MTRFGADGKPLKAAGKRRRKGGVGGVGGVGIGVGAQGDSTGEAERGTKDETADRSAGCWDNDDEVDQYTLCIVAHRARGLKAMDQRTLAVFAGGGANAGSSDPYLELTVADAPIQAENGLSAAEFASVLPSTGQSISRTQVIEKELNPVWQQKFSLQRVKPTQTLQVVCKDRDPGFFERQRNRKSSATGANEQAAPANGGKQDSWNRDDVIGRLDLELEGLSMTQGDAATEWYPLRDAKGQPTGQVQLQLYFKMDGGDSKDTAGAKLKSGHKRPKQSKRVVKGKGEKARKQE